MQNIITKFSWKQWICWSMKSGLYSILRLVGIIVGSKRGRQDVRPPLGPITFREKNWPNNRLAPPPWVLAPPVWEILDPPPDIQLVSMTWRSEVHLHMAVPKSSSVTSQVFVCGLFRTSCTICFVNYCQNKFHTKNN